MIAATRDTSTRSTPTPIAVTARRSEAEACDASHAGAGMVAAPTPIRATPAPRRAAPTAPATARATAASGRPVDLVSAQRRCSSATCVSSASHAASRRRAAVAARLLPVRHAPPCRAHSPRARAPATPSSASRAATSASRPRRVGRRSRAFSGPVSRLRSGGARAEHPNLVGGLLRSPRRARP